MARLPGMVQGVVVQITTFAPNRSDMTLPDLTTNLTGNFT